MLTDTLFRVPRRDGLQLLQRRDGSLARELTSWRLHLAPGASQAYRAHDLRVPAPHARRPIVGATCSPSAHRSRFPRHKRDGGDGGPVLEEVSRFRVDPPQGFGHPMLYTADGETVTHTVRDGDAVLLP